MAETDSETRADLPPWVAGVENRMHELNPELTEDQLATVAGYGETRTVADGDWLWRAGDVGAGFFVVLSGQLEIVNETEKGEYVIIRHGRGHYGGEVATMGGRGALVSGRVKGQTEVIVVEPARAARAAGFGSRAQRDDPRQLHPAPDAHAGREPGRYHPLRRPRRARYGGAALLSFAQRDPAQAD